MSLITITFVENTIRWTSTAVTEEIFKYYYIRAEKYYDENY